MDIFALLREKDSTLYLERGFSFARHTTIGCGGRASVAAYPSNPAQACALLSYLDGEKIPYCYLGAGANVLPSDEDFDGVVVRFTRMRRLAAEGDEVIAESGVTGGALLRFAREKRRGGLEFFTGIPMTAGGAAAMNAGVSERHCSDVVTRVMCVCRGKIAVFGENDLRYGDKTSIFLEDGLAVLRVHFRTARSARGEIERERARFAARRASLPAGRSMGCVFVNPAGRSAGAIVDACGLKGISVGGARVSEKHANFILNEGATASEIAELIEIVKLRVLESTGIALREEIRRLPPVPPAHT